MLAHAVAPPAPHPHTAGLPWYRASKTLAAPLFGLMLAACAQATRAPAVARQTSAPASAPVKTAPASSVPAASPLPESPATRDDLEAEENTDGPGWLGVELALRMPDEPGVLVRGVVPGSPAERAGVHTGDVITSVDGTTVGRPSELVAEVSSRHPGARVALSLLRGGDPHLLAAELESLPSEEALMKKRFLSITAPAFGELKQVQGNLDLNRDSLRGKVLVLEFWATWCAPCRLTAPLLSGWSDRHAAEGLRVIGVTGDAFALAADSARSQRLTYSIFVDEEGATIRAYRAFALPTLFVIDRKGLVRDVMVGFSSARLRQVDALVRQLLAER